MNWVQRLRRGRELDRKIDRELRFHLEQHAAELVAEGRSPGEARRQAALALGGVDQTREACRDARGTRWLTDFWQAARYGLRGLLHRPGFTAASVATLALGIGLTTLIFTLVEGVLLKPRPYHDPGRLLAVMARSAGGAASDGPTFAAYPDFLDLRAQLPRLDRAAWVFDDGTITGPPAAERADVFEITANLFPLLGVSPHTGRDFTRQEDAPGGAAVAILSYSLWQSRFHGSRSALGAPLDLDGQQFTIVGIAPPGLQLDLEEPDVYVPLGRDAAPYLHGRRAHPVRILGRLPAAENLARAGGEVAAVGRRLAQTYPATNGRRSYDVENYQSAALAMDVGDARTTLWLLQCAVGLVLLIACANVASLLLSRAVSREPEMAMRAALGAGKGRLIRQCLTESAILGLGGGALGVAFATLGLHPLIRNWPGQLPRADAVALDWRVLTFALAVSLACGLEFGILPALRAARESASPRLQSSSRAVAPPLHPVFLVAEIALGVALLVPAGMIGRTLLSLAGQTAGFDTHDVLVMRVAIAPVTLNNPNATRAAWDSLLNAGARLPQVSAIAAVDTVPMRDGYNQNGYWTNAALPPEQLQPQALSTCVTNNYFKVFGIAPMAGRLFSESDRSGTPPVVVIDDVMARAAFGNSDPVGRQLWIPDLGATPKSVIGVVPHVKYWGLAGDGSAALRAEFYYPFSQLNDGLVARWSELMSLVVKTAGPPMDAAPALRQIVGGRSQDQAAYQVQTMDALRSASLAQQRFLALLFGVFAALALLLACVGVYGVLAYRAQRRVPEIGIRMALGATPRDVQRQVLGEGARIVAFGGAVGSLLALAAATALTRSVTGLQPLRASTLAMMLALLAAAALGASFLPARRASRIDPMSALRES